MTSGSNCYLCTGKGSWVDTFRRQTLICPVCRPASANAQSTALTRKMPDWSDRWDHMEAKHYGPRFNRPPWLLVIHCGSSTDNVAEYFHTASDSRKVSTHLAWSRKHGRLVQCVPFNHVAWHVGGARYLGSKRLNYVSIGIELPGPPERDRKQDEYRNFVDSVCYLLGIFPSLSHVVGHQDIDKRKRDPGEGFDWGCLSGLGLKGANLAA